MRYLFVLFLAYLGASFVSLAHADEHGVPVAPAMTNSQRAQGLFLSSREQMRAGQFAEAVSSLELSLRLHPNPASAFALVIALRGMGDYRGTGLLLEALLAGAYGELSPNRIVALNRIRDEITPSLVRLELRICGGTEQRAWLDGHPALVAERCEIETLLVNPGEHHITASAADGEPISEVIVLEAGERRRLDLRFVAAETNEPAWYRTPWIWVAVGIVAAGAGTGIALGINRRHDNPNSTLPGEVVQALR